MQVDGGNLPARWIGLFGLGLAASSVIAWTLAPIHVDAETARGVAAHYSEHRTGILRFAYLGAIGTALQLPFFVALRGLAAAAPVDQALSRLGLAAMLVEVVGVSLAFSTFGAIAYREPSPDVAQALNDVAWIAINLGAGPVTSVGLSAFALVLWRSRAVGAWLLPFTAVVALAHLVVAATFAREGAFAPVGEVSFAVPLVFFSWFAAVGVALAARRRPRGLAP